MGDDQGVLGAMAEVLGISPHTAALAAQRKHLMDESIRADREKLRARAQVAETLRTLLPSADRLSLELQIENYAQAIAKAKYAEDKLITQFPGAV